MYCQNCGTEIPEGGGYCSECGKPVNVPVQQTTSCDLAAPESNAINANPKPRNPHVTKIAIGVAVGVLLLIIVGIALFSFAERSTEPQGVHVPTIEEIEKKANSVMGGRVSFKPNYNYHDSYFILFNDKEAGKLFLNASSSESIGIYIEKKDVDDPYLAFSQICVGAIEACDPSLKLDDAKEILSQSLNGKKAEWHEVSYVPTTSSDRYILRISIPEDSE